MHKIGYNIEITSHDFFTAIRFLKDKLCVGFTNYHATAKQMFEDKY